VLSHLARAEATDQRDPARLAFGIENVEEPQQRVGLQRRSAFDAERILHAAHELDMRVVRLARAVANPDQVARGVVPVAARRIDARHGLLVAKQ
jgi:hypothetical protein